MPKRGADRASSEQDPVPAHVRALGTGRRAFDGLFPTVEFRTSAGALELRKVKAVGNTRPDDRVRVVIGGVVAVPPPGKTRGLLARLTEAVGEDIAGTAVRRILGRSAVTWTVRPALDVYFDSDDPDALVDTEALATAVDTMARALRAEVNVPRLISEARDAYGAAPTHAHTPAFGQRGGTERVVYECMGKLAEFGIVQLDHVMPELGYRLVRRPDRDLDDDSWYISDPDDRRNPLAINAEYRTTDLWVRPQYRASNDAVASAALAAGVHAAADGPDSLPPLSFDCDSIAVSPRLGVLFASGLRLVSLGETLASVDCIIPTAVLGRAWDAFPDEKREAVEQARAGQPLHATAPVKDSGALAYIRGNPSFLHHMLWRETQGIASPVAVRKFIDRRPERMEDNRRLNVKAFRYALAEVYLADCGAPAREAVATRLVAVATEARVHYRTRVRSLLEEGRGVGLDAEALARVNRAWRVLDDLAGTLTAGDLLGGRAERADPARNALPEEPIHE
jgi:hypothetical protein